MRFSVKAARNLSKGLLAVLREDNFNDLPELGFAVPALVDVRKMLKTKTTKTP